VNRSPRSRRVLGTLAVAGALGLAACGGGGSSGTSSSAEPVADAPLTPAPAGAASVPVLDFSAPIVNGEGQLDANTLAGSDTIVWFWAPW
jgi:multidrug efflux pump subunit AcrA (membrane-fusion protein)